MAQSRPMTADDREQVAQLLNDIFRTRRHVFDQDVLTDFPLVFSSQNYRNCRIICDSGDIVSHAAIWPCELVVEQLRLKLGVIVLVATHNDYRSRGYAAQLMRELQQTMHDEDYDLGILWTRVPDFYHKLGWQIVTPRGWLHDDACAQQHVWAKLEDISSGSYGEVVSYDRQRHLGGIIRIHEGEPIRVARSFEEYAALLQLPKIHVWVLERSGEVAAYVVIGRAVNKRGLIEYGGTCDDVATLVARLLRMRTFRRPLPLLVFHPYQQLANRIQDLGAPLSPFECSQGRGCEMIYVVRSQRVPTSVRERIFIWGLDFT